MLRRQTPVAHMAFLAALVSILIASAAAIKFELPALPKGSQDKNHRCLSSYVGRNVHVRGSFDVGPASGSHQIVDVNVFDVGPHANQYYVRAGADGVANFVLTTLDHAELTICFTNTLEEGFQPSPTLQRTISVTLDTGADALDDKALLEAARSEHLKPAELELQRLEKVLDDLVDEMEFLKARERRMRSTNESTNERILYFSLLSIGTILALAGWQVMYLKRFFHAKKLI
ncbi:emp24/gp25L/p24 family/GOLD-domain-containing protein [Blastocladiella britannica]|nr:emp24/gp25L/p24 family/GOLD-domain-containing protein [Blastocladiella britannica]